MTFSHHKKTNKTFGSLEVPPKTPTTPSSRSKFRQKSDHTFDSLEDPPKTPTTPSVRSNILARFAGCGTS